MILDRKLTIRTHKGTISKNNFFNQFEQFLSTKNYTTFSIDNVISYFDKNGDFKIASFLFLREVKESLSYKDFQTLLAMIPKEAVEIFKTLGISFDCFLMSENYPISKDSKIRFLPNVYNNNMKFLTEKDIYFVKEYLKNSGKTKTNKELKSSCTYLEYYLSKNKDINKPEWKYTFGSDIDGIVFDNNTKKMFYYLEYKNGTIGDSIEKSSFSQYPDDVKKYLYIVLTAKKINLPFFNLITDDNSNLVKIQQLDVKNNNGSSTVYIVNEKILLKNEELLLTHLKQITEPVITSSFPNQEQLLLKLNTVTNLQNDYIINSAKDINN